MSTQQTILGPTLEIDGEIEGEEDLVIQGKVKGKITSKKSLTIDQSGQLEAMVVTDTMTVSGKLEGNVEAATRIEIRADGNVVGDLKAPRIIIADGAKFKGHIEMGPID